MNVTALDKHIATRLEKLYNEANQKGKIKSLCLAALKEGKFTGESKEIVENALNKKLPSVSQSVLAELMKVEGVLSPGYDYKVVNYMLKGVRPLSIPQLDFFCNILDTNPNYLLGYSVDGSERVASAALLTGLPANTINELKNIKLSGNTRFSKNLAQFLSDRESASEFLELFYWYIFGDFDFSVDDNDKVSNGAIYVESKDIIMLIQKTDINDLLILQLEKHLFAWRDKFLKGEK